MWYIFKLLYYLILSIDTKSCKCVAVINVVWFLINISIIDNTIIILDLISVPLHNSSAITKLFYPLLFIIAFKSCNSTINDELPLNILSFVHILTKILLYG